MEGIALLLSSICINDTYCPPAHANIGVNTYEFLPRDLYKTEADAKNEMAKLAAEIKGQTLTVTTLEDFPLSYVERNGTTVQGKGWAFEFFDILANKFNFSYNIVVPQYNILGSSNDSQGSLMQMITQKVSRGVFSGSSASFKFFLVRRELTWVSLSSLYWLT